LFRRALHSVPIRRRAARAVGRVNPCSCVGRFCFRVRTRPQRSSSRRRTTRPRNGHLRRPRSLNGGHLAVHATLTRKIDLERTIRQTKKPPACTEGFVQFAKQILSADRYTGLQIRWTNNRQRRLVCPPAATAGVPLRRPLRTPAEVRLTESVGVGLQRVRVAAIRTAVPVCSS
jgi:hypothetical protein